jgi:hypothetical protein
MKSLKPLRIARHFVKRYLKFELRMFRWTQLSLKRVKEMEANLEIDEGLGYGDQNCVNKDMVEFHVDQHLLPFKTVWQQRCMEAT